MKLLPDNSNLTAVLEASRLYSLDLQGGSPADLSRANLNGADLRGANLYRANLFNANLYEASLNRADLGKANLEGADLRHADLRHADLRHADLRAAKLNFQSHALLAVVLRQEAGEDIAKRQIAGLVAISTDLCWSDFLKLRLKEREWALTTLASYIQPNDNHPGILDKYRKEA